MIMRRGTMPGQGGTFATLVGWPVSGHVTDQDRVILAVGLRLKSAISGECLPWKVS